MAWQVQTIDLRAPTSESSLRRPCPRAVTGDGVLVGLQIANRHHGDILLAARERWAFRSIDLLSGGYPGR
jgi:hypothetical protein